MVGCDASGKTALLSPNVWPGLLRSQAALSSAQEVGKGSALTPFLSGLLVAGTGPGRGGTAAWDLRGAGLPLHEKPHGVALPCARKDHQSEDIPARRWQRGRDLCCLFSQTGAWGCGACPAQAAASRGRRAQSTARPCSPGLHTPLKRSDNRCSLCPAPCSSSGCPWLFGLPGTCLPSSYPFVTWLLCVLSQLGSGRTVRSES